MQLNYGYATPAGIAGGLKDLSPYAIDTRNNVEATGVLLYGTGVVQGANSGNDINLPTTASTVAEFEGVAMNGFTTQHSLEGSIGVPENMPVGILGYGKAWVRVGEDANVSYGEDVYLITDGEEAGFFTTSADAVTKFKIKATWIGAKSGDIAPIELFNQKQEA